MSLVDGKGVSLFPLEWIKKCIAIYTKEHGQAPKVLVVSKDDFIDWHVSCTLAQANQFGIKMITGDYLSAGEIDLAMGIKDE